MEQEEGELIESSHSSRERSPEIIPESPERLGLGVGHPGFLTGLAHLSNTTGALTAIGTTDPGDQSVQLSIGASLLGALPGDAPHPGEKALSVGTLGIPAQGPRTE